MHVWLLREQSFAYFFHCLFVCVVPWENMNGSIFIRGAAQGETWGGVVFWWVNAGLGGTLESGLSWNCLLNCKVACYHTTSSISRAHTQKMNLFFIFPLLLFFFISPYAVPAEGLGKNRSFSLTSHQLRALTQLACTLLSFERTVRELVKNMSFVDFTEDTPCIKGTIQFHKKHNGTQ